MSARTAIVTGAARGIGAAVVAELTGQGVVVVAVDACCDDPALGYPLASREDLASVERAGRGRVRARVADVRDAVALAEIVAEAERELGGVDIAVAAAGAIAGGHALWESSPDEYDVLMDVNVRGVWNLATAVVPAMLRRPEPRSGRFVAVASAAAHRGLLHLAAYGAAKHAAVGLVKGLAADLHGSGVTAVAVSPGATDTEMLAATARLYGLPDARELAVGHLVGRALRPEEVAAAVGWVCSPAASALTGSVLHADGGFTT
jgi:SDR family mycofactocin-dependent oxidoreductase